MAETSSLFSILSNVRDAAVDFGARWNKPPLELPGEVGRLLEELGIADPGLAVTGKLAEVTQRWRQLGNEVSGANLNLVDLGDTMDALGKKSAVIQSCMLAIGNAPLEVFASLGASGEAIAAVFPRRLLDYIVYEALTKSHPKIAAAFLIFGVLRREFSAGSPPFTNAELRIFDLAQLVEVVTHPKEAVLKVLKWGTNDFNARPVIDGVALLAKVAGADTGADDLVFDLAAESAYGDEGRLGPDLRPSARRRIEYLADRALGLTKIDLVGLHALGLGVLAENPLKLAGGIGPFSPPELPLGVMLAITPGANPLQDPPKVKLLEGKP